MKKKLSIKKNKIYLDKCDTGPFCVYGFARNDRTLYEFKMHNASGEVDF